jgi:hypothetical protein
MALRTSFTRVFGAVIPSAWANAMRDHMVTIATSNDVSSEGQLCVNTAADVLVVHDGTAVRQLARYGPWDTWTATVVQSFGVGFTPNGLAVTRSGRHITASGILELTGNGSTGNQIIVNSNLPAPTAARLAGTFLYIDSGTAYYQGSVVIDAAAALSFQVHNSPAANLGTSPAFAIAPGDSLWLNLSYPASV